MQTFGEWLSERIAEKGISKVEFASTINVSYPALRAWCSGRQAVIRDYNLARIASALGITLAEIREKLTPVPSAHSNTDIHTPPRRSRKNGVSSPPQHVSRIAAAGA